MSYGSYTSLDSLAANGIIDFDANSYITGAPPRYAGRLNNNNYLPYQQPLMSYDSYGMMAPPMGYQGGGLGPMNNYRGPWTSVQPSHTTRHYVPSQQMHAQPHQDYFVTGHDEEKSSIKKWLIGGALGLLGFVGITKLINNNYDKKIKAAAAAAKAKAEAEAEAARPKTKAEAKAARKANYETFKKAEIKKGTSKFAMFFKKIGYKLKNAPKGLKITGIVLASLAAGIGIATSIAKKQVAIQQEQPQQPQPQIQQQQ